MPLQAQRALKQFKYTMYFDGINDYVSIPLTVYGWSGITIQEWIYPFHPKANTAWSKFSIIGDFWNNQPSLFYWPDFPIAYSGISMQFFTRRPDGTLGSYGYNIYAYRNMWVNIANRLSLNDRTFIGYVNGKSVYSATIPSTEYTILEWNPDTATNPWMYKQFVLGASVSGAENMKMMQAGILIYSRALSDNEIQYNYQHFNNPITNGLVLWLQADPKYIQGNTWLDLSGYGNNGTIYGAQLIQLEKTPARILNANRILKVVR